jgi:hypothetical protein
MYLGLLKRVAFGHKEPVGYAQETKDITQASSGNGRAANAADAEVTCDVIESWAIQFHERESPF